MNSVFDTGEITPLCLPQRRQAHLLLFHPGAKPVKDGYQITMPADMGNKQTSSAYRPIAYVHLRSTALKKKCINVPFFLLENPKGIRF